MNRRLAVTSLAAALLAAGCEEPNVADLSIKSQSAPFYWHLDLRVHLRIDPKSLTVETDARNLPVLASSLNRIGVSVDSNSAMSDIPGLWIMWLHAGTAPAAAEAAAEALRRHSSVAFVSNAYLYGEPSTGCTLRLVNRVGVKYKSTTTLDQIGELHHRAGLVVEREASGPARPSWWLRYPGRSLHTPLEIAAAINRHPFVEWASADMVGCLSLLNGAS